MLVLATICKLSIKQEAKAYYLIEGLKDIDKLATKLNFYKFICSTLKVVISELQNRQQFELSLRLLKAIDSKRIEFVDYKAYAQTKLGLKQEALVELAVIEKLLDKYRDPSWNDIREYYFTRLASCYSELQMNKESQSCSEKILSIYLSHEKEHPEDHITRRANVKKLMEMNLIQEASNLLLANISMWSIDP